MKSIQKIALICMLIVCPVLCFAKAEKISAERTEVAASRHPVPLNSMKDKIAIGKLKHGPQAIVTHLFSHEGLAYFIGGGLLLFITCRLIIISRWFDFLHSLQHELVHLIAAGWFGGIPVSLEVSAEGGTAYTTKTNFIVRLSPYVLPLFCLLILGISFFLNTSYKPVAVVMAGLFYGNFIRKTFSSLNIQTDIQKSGGRLIAYPLIFIGNISMLALITYMVRVR